MLAVRLKTALLVGWLALSTLLLPSLVTPLLLPEVAIAVLGPECERRAVTGEECGWCAVTNSFLLAAGGRIDAAVRRSPFGLPIYAALLWNECLVLIYTTGELRWLIGQMRRVKKRAGTEEVSCRL